MHTWPGAELVSARSIERTLLRQRESLAALAGTAAAGLLVLPAEAGRILGTVAVIAAFGAVVISAARVVERDRGDRSADALIEDGFRYERRSDAVSRAVAERVRRLESARKRRSLAEALRAHVELDRAPPNPAALRYSTAPVVRGLGQHADVVERIAAEFERGACDPRAIIQVERLLTMPPDTPDGHDRAELGRRLRGIARLLGVGP